MQSSAAVFEAHGDCWETESVERCDGVAGDRDDMIQVKIMYSAQRFQRNSTSQAQYENFMCYTMLNLNYIYYMNINMNMNEVRHIQAVKKSTFYIWTWRHW